jgi:hypothetical protein
MDEKTENYWKILETNLDWIRYSDAKATGILTIYGLLVTIAFTNLNRIIELVGDSTLYITISSIAGLTSLLAIVYGFKSMSPRIVNEEYNSIIFFGSVVKNHTSMEDFRLHSHEVMNSKVGLDDDLARQIYINAKIAQQKFKDVSNSLRFLMVSMAALLAQIISVILNN